MKMMMMMNLRHNLVKYWISLTKDEKTNFIDVVNKYWEKNNYTEYIPWKITYIKENDILDVRNKGVKSIDLIITDDIKYLNCSQNKIKRLDDLPIGLEVLICENNPIKSLNNLPRGLKYLCCDGSDLTELLNLPPDLRYLDISNNFLETIELPQYIETLHINMIHDGYNVKILEDIPNMIKDLESVN
jgi:Leucine-rich repeat (LRR) protein